MLGGLRARSNSVGRGDVPEVGEGGRQTPRRAHSFRSCLKKESVVETLDTLGSVFLGVIVSYEGGSGCLFWSTSLVTCPGT